MNQELESKKKFRDFNEVCEEAAVEIDGIAKVFLHKMWEIGRILVRKQYEVNPPLQGAFYAGVAKEMKEDMEVRMLNDCAQFYRKFPDLATRVAQSNLSPSHYYEMSKRNIPKEQISKIEKKYSQKAKSGAPRTEWSVSKLREELYHEPAQLDLGPDYEQKYNAWSSAATEFYTSLEELKEHFDKLAKDERDKIADNLFVFFTVKLPDVIEALIKSGATVRPEFKAYLKKTRGGDNEAR